MWALHILLVLVGGAVALPLDTFNIAREYFAHKNVRHVCFVSCNGQRYNAKLVKHLMAEDMSVSVSKGLDTLNAAAALAVWNTAVGVLLDGDCDNMSRILETASRSTLFDAMHIWLVVSPEEFGNDSLIEEFQHYNLSVDADIAIAVPDGDHYKLVDVFNFGRIQGNNLEKNLLGAWRRDSGLNISLEGFKYYNRWDFHNLTLRAVSVIRDKPNVFTPSLLEDVHYTPGVSAMTKVVSQLLNILKEQHNFRFNYTIVGRWVGSPERRNTTTLAVTNLLFWREQDISATCLRIYPHWLEWVDPFFPPATLIETKFYYLIPNTGVGEYENRFITPLSPGVWVCACAACVACAATLATAAAAERRQQPALYATCSVIAAVCQQAYDDGVQLVEETFSSQSRRLSLLVVGLTSMLLYNYYTSSVVSWLLSAAPPTVAGLDGLIRSDLQLVFEDIGYTRGWLDNPGFYYYSGFKNPKEDELRERKVTNAKRTVPLMQSVEDGIELVRTRAFAYHTEPYVASRIVGRKFSDRDLCDLGALQMMPPSHVYVMGQKNSPYKQFFVWSFLRLLERGHTQASQRRVDSRVPSCSGTAPRALALGQAAPAFLFLLQMYCLAVFILAVEIFWHSEESRCVYGGSSRKKSARTVYNHAHNAGRHNSGT